MNMKTTSHTLMAIAVLSAIGLSSATSFAQAPASAPATASATAPAKKEIVALVSAVGDQFTYVRQKESTGSNIIDNNNRRTVKVTNNVLNMAVLRGLDAAAAQANPESERVFISLTAAEMEGVLPQKREEIALGKIVSALEKMPERMNWSKIVVATPKYLLSEHSGMGTKLHGLGVYVQPLQSATIQGTGGGEGDVFTGAQDITGDMDNGTFDPNSGKKNKQSHQTFVAPYSYIQVYTLDPKTLRVIDKNSRHDFTKFHDPNATALDVGKSIPMDLLGTRIAALIERSAMRAAGGTPQPQVTIEEKLPAGATPAPTTTPAPTK
jgi:hypothetical protein